MTCESNIPLFGILSKPSFLDWLISACPSWLWHFLYSGGDKSPPSRHPAHSQHILCALPIVPRCGHRSRRFFNFALSCCDWLPLYISPALYAGSSLTSVPGPRLGPYTHFRLPLVGPVSDILPIPTEYSRGNPPDCPVLRNRRSVL